MINTALTYKPLQEIDYSIYSSRIVKSPLNYIGGKHKLLSQILPLFPKKIENFVDLFTGGCNVGVNVNANNVICNDNLLYLIDLYKVFLFQSQTEIMNHIENQIQKFGLTITDNLAYNTFREYYNFSRNPLDLFVLIAFSFNHQIRFNNSHEFNNPFGKDRSCFNETMKSNLIQFINKLQQKSITFSCQNFDEFDFANLTKNDFVYADPPYLITTGTYNDGMRGFKGWDEKEELKLLQILDYLNDENISFALSNVLEHKGKENILLKKWVAKNNYFVNHLSMNYANSNYQTLNRDKIAA